MSGIPSLGPMQIQGVPSTSIGNPISSTAHSISNYGTTSGNNSSCMTQGPVSNISLHPPQATQAQFNETITGCNNCLYLIRKLRTQMNLSQNAVLCVDFSKPDALEQYKEIDRMMNDVKDIYDQLEGLARRLPKTIPPIDNLNNMRSLYAEEYSLDNENINLKLENMIDASNWNEGNFQMFHFLSELLRSGYRKKFTVFANRSMRPPGAAGNMAHLHFEQAIMGLSKEIQHKNLGFHLSILKSVGSSTVVEFKYCVAGPEKSDKTSVCLMKFLLIENNGHLEYINIVSPEEEWCYDGDFGEKTVDPTYPSQYSVFKKLTKHVNIQLLHTFASTNRWNSASLLQLIIFLGKLRDVYDFRCRVCKKILKNFCPPTVCDIRQPKETAVHESCK